MRYCKSTIFQANHNLGKEYYDSKVVVCDTAKVRFFKQITTVDVDLCALRWLFAILQKYDFSSKSQRSMSKTQLHQSCLRYCKSTIFQANHNVYEFFFVPYSLFAILQKYDFSSKSQPYLEFWPVAKRCLRYCKSTIFQANHNDPFVVKQSRGVVCDTAKVRFFKQITTEFTPYQRLHRCLRYCKSTIFQANHNGVGGIAFNVDVVCDTAKVRFFKQITTHWL